MRVRKQSSTGDFTFGQSLGNYWVDVPDGVAQVIGTRLRLNLGEWFLDTTDGTNWQTGVLGPRTTNTRDPIVRARILGTPNVLNLASYSSQVAQDGSRGWSAQATVNTSFGKTNPIFIPSPGVVSKFTVGGSDVGGGSIIG